MTYLVTFLFLAFSIALLAGLKLSESNVWKYIDVKYYLLGGIGVVLLFANTSAQRDLIQVSKLEEEHKRRIAELSEKKPHVNLVATNKLLDADFAMIATIPEFAAVCRNTFQVEPRCEAAMKLQQPIDTFVQSIGKLSNQPVEQRLLSACIAADQMLFDINKKKLMFSKTSDELLTQYNAALISAYAGWDFESTDSTINAFETSARSHVETTRMELGDTSTSGKFVFDMYVHQIEFGKLLLQGLMPCITAPRKELDSLATWTSTRQSEESLLLQLDTEKDKIKNSGPSFPILAQIQFFVWPYVFIIAIALKFAKAVAEIKRHRASQNNSNRQSNHKRYTETLKKGVARIFHNLAQWPKRPD